MVTSFLRSELALRSLDRSYYPDLYGLRRAYRRARRIQFNTAQPSSDLNPVGENFFPGGRAVDEKGKFKFTRPRLQRQQRPRRDLNNSFRADFSSLRATRHGGNPEPAAIIIGAGAANHGSRKQSADRQDPGDPLPASFNITQLATPADKIGKDTELPRPSRFSRRPLFHQGQRRQRRQYCLLRRYHRHCVHRCERSRPSRGIRKFAPRPRSLTSPAVLQTKGLDPNNMCILKASLPPLKSKTSFPFGIWFANANTLYVADEGNGDNS